MQVSKTLDYAVRSLTFMGINPEYKYSMKEISDKKHIPVNYLAKIMRRLVNRGIIRSMVGPEGGYLLRRPPSDINLREVYEAIEGEIRIIDCMDKENLCALYENCTQLPVWDKLKVSMVKILEDTTLEDMVRDIENIEVKTTLNN
ncbi:MAG: Rrf2 family transcriptional regulator [Candidatus Dadabacteria bacterium]|nr:Rrf2 family transcriptional regulator [Candidatus Dadabacteria bacterium]NIQ14051.1 Rrf2 family transcriptional regulator [Candidatus Dadabacteria bacterium]